MRWIKISPCLACTHYTPGIICAAVCVHACACDGGWARALSLRVGLLHITVSHCLSPEEFTANTTAPSSFTLVSPCLGWGGVWHRIRARSDPDCWAGVYEILPAPNFICLGQNKMTQHSLFCPTGPASVLRNNVLAVRWLSPFLFVPKQSVIEAISQMTEDLSKTARGFGFKCAGVKPCWFSCSCVGFHREAAAFSYSLTTWTAG